MAVAAGLHRAPPAGPALGVIVVGPPAVLGVANLQSRPRPLVGSDRRVGEDPAERSPRPTLRARELGLRCLAEAYHERQVPKTKAPRVGALICYPRVGRRRRAQGVSYPYGQLAVRLVYRLVLPQKPAPDEPGLEPLRAPQPLPLLLRLPRMPTEPLQIQRVEELVDEPHLFGDLSFRYALVHRTSRRK